MKHAPRYLRGLFSFALCTSLWLVTAAPAWAQPASAAPLSDSTRQLVHRLFQQARLFSGIGTVTSSLLVGSGTSYALQGAPLRTTGYALGVGSIGLPMGIITWVRFSRRRERAVLAALERGQPLPAYAVRRLPLLGH